MLTLFGALNCKVRSGSAFIDIDLTTEQILTLRSLSSQQLLKGLRIHIAREI